MTALTTRETEILQWVLTGKPDAEIAAILGLSTKTVNFHVQNAKQKLGTRSRIEAIVVALYAGLVTFAGGPKSAAAPPPLAPPKRPRARTHRINTPDTPRHFSCLSPAHTAFAPAAFASAATRMA